MILSDRDLRMLALAGKLVDPFDEALLNPASIDIRVGLRCIREVGPNAWRDFDLSHHSQEFPALLRPNEFILLETAETLMVPNGYAMECKLKSSAARKGWNHSLAFWFDPGWIGVGTFEFKNISRYQDLLFWPGMRICQIVYHRLSSDAEHPYNGRYQGAKQVELAKPEK